MKEHMLWADMVHSPHQTGDRDNAELIDACKHKKVVWTLLNK